MIMNSYMYILSNASVHHFDNTLSKFTNRIPISLEALRVHRVRVALQAISVNTAVVPGYQPKLIHVCMNTIAEDFYSGASTKILHTIPFPQGLVRLDHVINRKTYFNLTSNDLNNITIELLDENLKRLQIVTGESTVIQLKMSNIRKFPRIIRIASSDSLEHFPKNTTSKFRVKLNHPIRSPSERYEIALDSMYYFNDTIYKPKNEAFVIITRRNTGEELSRTELTQRDFENEGQLIDTINQSLSKRKVSFRKNDNGYLEIANSEYFDVDIGMTNNIQYIMGHADVPSVEEGYSFLTIANRYVAKPYDYTFDLSRIYPQNIVMYCDVIKPIISGESQQKILKTIPLEYTGGQRYVQYSAKHLDFCTIDPPKFSELTVELGLMSGLPLNFKSKKPVYCTFQIRRKKYI